MAEREKRSRRKRRKKKAKGLVQGGRIRFRPLCTINSGWETQEDVYEHAKRSSGLRIRVVKRKGRTLKSGP